MEHILAFLRKMATAAITQAFPSDDLHAVLPAEITQTAQAGFGDYQCNSAMKLAKVLKIKPRDVAEKIARAWNLLGKEAIETLEVAGPGFINITLSTSFLSKQLTCIAGDPRLGIPKALKKEKVIVEFSSPNVAKELHVGHLRSTIIGESLARLFEFLGHEVLRLNHIGDWGTQFGMLIAYLFEKEPEVVSEKKEADLSLLMQWYREAKKLFDLDPAFKQKARSFVIKLQGGEKNVFKAWEMIRAISRRGFQEIYDVLGVELIERGESFYNPDLPEVVSDLEKKGLLSVSDGAKCFFLDGFLSKEGDPLPLIVQKSDGGYNYATTDLAALKQRIEKEKADRIIYVVDAGQKLHFQMVFQAAIGAGYFNPEKTKVNHVPFGVVLGPDGKKFKTRSGKTERLIDLLNEAVVRAKKILFERNPDLLESDLDKMAHTLGIDAIKYADLSGHRVKDYVFSYDKMLNFEGNTAAYLLYCYVRIRGIERKVAAKGDKKKNKVNMQLIHPSERSLALLLLQFSECLAAMERDLLPNRLSDYLYTVSEKFHRFFHDCRVEGSDSEGSRLLLCQVTANVLKQGLYLLGLDILDRM